MPSEGLSYEDAVEQVTAPGQRFEVVEALIGGRGVPSFVNAPHTLAVITADEWTRTLRTDPSYGWSKTDGAKREAMGLVSSLGQMFGSA